MRGLPCGEIAAGDMVPGILHKSNQDRLRSALIEIVAKPCVVGLKNSPRIGIDRRNPHVVIGREDVIRVSIAKLLADHGGMNRNLDFQRPIRWRASLCPVVKMDDRIARYGTASHILENDSPRP